MIQAFADAREMREYLPHPDLFTDMRAVLGQGEGTDLVVIKSNPSWYDANGGKPLLGQDGLAIRKALFDLGVKFYATNCFPFVGPTGKVKASEYKLAEPVFAEELNRIGGQKFLLLGATAARNTPIFKRPFKKHNELLGRNLEVDGKLFRVVHAPMALANTPGLYAEFLRAVEELLDPSATPEVDAPEREVYRVWTNAHQARKVIEAMPEVVACDTETTGLDPYTCDLLTIQLSPEPGIGHSFPWDLFTPEEWAYHLGKRKLIFQNGQYDVKVLANHGVFVRIHEDTMLMHSLVDETKGTHDMEQMAQRYLGIDKWSELVNYESMEDNDLRTLGRYGARDTDITLRLANVFRPKVEGRFIHEVLHRAQNSIVRSELRGIRIDREKAFEFQAELEGHIHDREEYIRDVHGIENPRSSKQVIEHLLNIGVPLRKENGKYTSKEEAISPFADEFPVIKDILEFRHLEKANGTYVKNILALSERDGRYHPEFKLAATETGRLGESLILLIPRADDLKDPDLGKQYQVRLRELFIADEGHVLIGADYSGLEVAMAAYITGDEQLIHDVTVGLDTHSAVAIEAFGLDIPLEPYETLKARVSERYSYQRTLAKSGCVPMDTEILTIDGWRTYDEIAVGDLVLTYNQERDVTEWQPIEEKVLYHDAEVMRVSNGHNWSVRATPDHRWYGHKRVDRGAAGRAYEPAIFHTEDFGPEHRITTTAVAEGGDSPLTAAEARLLGWLFTDGSYQWHAESEGGSQGNGSWRRGIDACIIQKKPAGRADIETNLAWALLTSYDRGDGCYRYRLSSPVVREVWEKAGLDKDAPDLVPLVTRLSQEARAAFLDACLLAEGHTHRDGGLYVSQNAGHVQQAIQLAAFLEGYDVRTTWRDNPNGPHAVMNLRTRRHVTGQRVVKEHLERQDVWCVQTPNHTWVMRQGDTITITGNTFAWLYGGEEDAVMSGMGINDRDIARQVLLTLRNRYRGVAAWQERVKEQARQTGSVTTPWGRTRRFVWHFGLDRKVHAEQEREAINQPNQAMATDMNLLAFTLMEERGLQTLFPMHDACYLQEREDRAETTKRQVVDIMESVLPGPVPFRAEATMGRSWADL